MPLFDHFHPPIGDRFAWQSVHSRWISSIADALNRSLPFPRYSAQSNVHARMRIEADVAELEQEILGPVPEESTNGTVAVLTEAPPTTAVMTATFPDEYEIQIFDLMDSRTLVGVVELVSPSNKDRPESRQTFSGKCAAYLQVGVGVLVVDIVTERHSRPHDDLVDLLNQSTTLHLAAGQLLAAVSYRPTRRSQQNLIDVWAAPLTLGERLPTLPLSLRRGPIVMLDIEATYAETCERMHIS